MELRTLENRPKKVKITFSSENGQTRVSEMFDVRNIKDNTALETERGGWQAILNSFKNYIEQNNESLKSL